MAWSSSTQRYRHEQSCKAHRTNVPQSIGVMDCYLSWSQFLSWVIVLLASHINRMLSMNQMSPVKRTLQWATRALLLVCGIQRAAEV